MEQKKELTEEQKKVVALIEEMHNLRDGMNASIREFDSKLSDLMYHLNESETTMSINEAKQWASENQSPMYNTLIRMEMWHRVWGSVSNGVRCVLGDY